MTRVIRVGIGGWTYEPWRGTFYPEKLPHARELGYASRQLTTIEINSTFYGSQKPSSFRRWADEVPDDFVFSLKAPRAAVNRRVLAEAGPSIERFLESGIVELGDKLGPILWQLAPTKAFDEEDLTAFLELLPSAVGGRPLRHALEVRHDSFRNPRFVALARRFGAAVVLAHSERYPTITDTTGDFVYARLQQSVASEPTGYPASALKMWAERFRALADGEQLTDLPRLADDGPTAASRACFVYLINGAKVRAPAAAVALLDVLAST